MILVYSLKNRVSIKFDLNAVYMWVKRQLMHGACIEYDVTKLFNVAK